MYSDPRRHIVPEGISQVWNWGRFEYPESQMEKEQRLKAAMDNGGINYVRYVRDLHGFATDKQAMAYIDKMKEQDGLEGSKYKAPTGGGGQQNTFESLTAGLKSREPRKVNF